MSKSIYSKEEVICDRQQNVSKTGGNIEKICPCSRIVGNLQGEDGRVKKSNKIALIKTQLNTTNN